MRAGVIALLLLVGLAACGGSDDAAAPVRTARESAAPDQPTARRSTPSDAESSAESAAKESGSASAAEASETSARAACTPADPDLLAAVATGLTAEGGGVLRTGFVVPSAVDPARRFLAAELDAVGLEGDGDVLMFSVGEAPSFGMILPANAIADEFSDWADAGDGVTDRSAAGEEAAARQCLSYSYQG